MRERKTGRKERVKKKEMERKRTLLWRAKKLEEEKIKKDEDRIKSKRGREEREK